MDPAAPGGLLGRHGVGVLAQNATALYRTAVLALGHAAYAGAAVFLGLEHSAARRGVLAEARTGIRQLTLACGLARGSRFAGIGAAFGHITIGTGIATCFTALMVMGTVRAMGHGLHVLGRGWWRWRGRLGAGKTGGAQREGHSGHLQSLAERIFHGDHPYR